MYKLSIAQITEKIENEIPFEAVAEDYSFTLKISEYAPYVCAAVHDGHQFRKGLWDKCLHTEYERWYEEDPCTKAMVRGHPIVLAGRDSRFEYDINRDPEGAIHQDAWGKKLWSGPLGPEQKRASIKKHENFYRVVDALVKKIENKYGRAIVFDMHSYNWKRWDREVPTWNLGTSNIDNGRYGKIVEAWRQKLGSMHLPNGIKSTSRINDTFQGNGYFLRHITHGFRNTLVLATEIAKIYGDEETGLIYPEVVHSIEDQLNNLIPLQVKEFRDHNL